MLEESMKCVKYFNTIEEMKQYIVDTYWRPNNGDLLFDIDDIVIKEDSFSDDRIGWKNDHYVCIKRLGKDDYIKMYGCPQCIGTCDLGEEN
jgi:hypothetical protein